MMVDRTATRAGHQWESTLVTYFREQGWEADRLHLSGAEDEGDIVLRHAAGLHIVEAKRCKKMDLAGWVTQAETEAANYAKHRGQPSPPSWAVIAQRRNHSTRKAYVILTMDEWIKQIGQ